MAIVVHLARISLIFLVIRDTIAATKTSTGQPLDTATCLGRDGRDGLSGLPGRDGLKGEKGEKGETVISDRDLAVIKADVVDLKNQTTLVHDINIMQQMCSARRLLLNSLTRKCVPPAPATLTDSSCTLKTKGVVRHNHTVDDNLIYCNGLTWQAVFSNDLGGSRNPALSCSHMKSKGVSESGTYHFMGKNGHVYSTYCDMTTAGGGWTFVASINEQGSLWNYYSSRWTSRNTVNDASYDVYSGERIDRKHESFNNIPVSEIMITDHSGSNYHVMYQLYGSQSGTAHSSLRDLFANGGTHIWGNRRNFPGSGMWAYSNWALNNVELTGDECWCSRIAVCKQTFIGHTGGGGLLGISCDGGRSRNTNLMISHYRDRVAWRCAASGQEPRDLPLSDNTYFNIFVRDTKADEGLGRSELTPAASCLDIKRTHPEFQSGIYWLATGQTVYKTYCDMTIDGGGFTFAASVGVGSEWYFNSPRWTDSSVVRPESLDIYNGRKIDRKHTSYSTASVKEIMITNYNGSAYYVMYNFMGDSTMYWSSLSAVFGSGRNFLWANRKSSRGGGIWSSSNWALNNIDTSGDHCWDSRINVCKQTHVGHTAGGVLIGLGCPHKKQEGNINLSVQRSRQTWSCVGSGNEKNDLEIPADTYYNIFIR